MTLSDGRSLNIVELPMPPGIEREGQRLPASYANFYITNHSVLLPTFAVSSDKTAIGILTDLFPTRTIIPIDCRELIWGLGAFHCLNLYSACWTNRGLSLKFKFKLIFGHFVTGQ